MAPTRRRYILGSLAGAAGIVGGCTAKSTRQTDQLSVTVGSKGHPENRILGYLAYEAIARRTNARPVDEIGFGGTEDSWNALVDGELSCYWEYTGTHYRALPPKRSDHPQDPQRLADIVSQDASNAGVEVFERASFDNTFVLLADTAWSRQTGVETLSDLADHVNAGNTDFGVALGDDFATRSDGWPALTEHYGFESDGLRALSSNVRRVPIGISYQLYRDSEVSVLMGFNTDPQPQRLDVESLDDDEGFLSSTIPPRWPTPRQSTLMTTSEPCWTTSALCSTASRPSSS